MRVFGLLLYVLFIPVALAQTPLKLGGIFDLSGSGVDWGTTEANAFRLAIEEFSVGHPDLRIDSSIEDSGNANHTAVAAFSKLTSIDEVRYVIGPSWETFENVSPLCWARKTICIAPSWSSPAFSSNPYTVTLWFQTEQYVQALLKEPGTTSLRRIAMVVGTSPYYEILRAEALRAFGARLVRVDQVTNDEREFRSLIAHVSSDVDALLLLLPGDGSLPAFLQTWIRQRKTRPFLLMDDAADYMNPKLDLRRYGFEGWISRPRILSPAERGFEERYVRRFKQPPKSASGAATYDGTLLLLNCHRRTPNHTLEVVNCLNATREYEGASGILTISGNRTSRTHEMSVGSLAEPGTLPRIP